MVGSQDPHPSASSIAALVHRRKLIWRVALICNFGIGAYIFALAASKKNGGSEVQKAGKRSSSVSKAKSLPEENLKDPYDSIRASLPHDEQQQQQHKMLEEKRQFEPQEDKRILQQFMGPSKLP